MPPNAYSLLCCLLGNRLLSRGINLPLCISVLGRSRLFRQRTVRQNPIKLEADISLLLRKAPTSRSHRLERHIGRPAVCTCHDDGIHRTAHSRLAFVQRIPRLTCRISHAVYSHW